MRPRPLALLLLTLGCRAGVPASAVAPAPEAQASPAGAPAPAPVPPPAPPQARELPAGWASAPLEQFGELLEKAFPAGERATLVPSGFEELSSALRGADEELSLRALELLARCSDPLAGELLLQRLERRTAPRGELGATVDIAAAMALRAFPAVRNAGGRLESLGFGPRPHPDLEVRVACACSALRLGPVRGIPFLLSILKHGTRIAVASSSWKPIRDMSFCQRQAAEALCERAGRPCRFRPLQPLDEREADIRVLETQLAPRRK
jgi:hypothetical protein